MAQWIRLCLSSYRPGFGCQAHHTYILLYFMLGWATLKEQWWWWSLQFYCLKMLGKNVGKKTKKAENGLQKNICPLANTSEPQ